MGAIARNVGVFATTILRWVKKFAKNNDVKPEPGDAIVVEINEMCHYVGKKTIKPGFGKPYAGKLGSSSIGSVVGEIKKRFGR